MSDPRDYTYDDPEDDGVLDPDDTLETDDLTDDPLDTGIEPGDRYGASSWHGVTEAEARNGQSLEQLLDEEEADPNSDVVLDYGPGDEEYDRVYAEVGFLEEIEDEDGEFGDGGPVVDDRWPDGPGPRSGRLVGDGRLGADDVGPDADAAGAEEAAVHLEEEEDELRYRPPGAG